LKTPCLWLPPLFSSIVLAIVTPSADSFIVWAPEVEPLEHPTGKQLFHQRFCIVLIMPLISAWLKCAFATTYYLPGADTTGAVIRAAWLSIFFFPEKSCWQADICKGSTGEIGI
jgi:hypothetical protein